MVRDLEWSGFRVVRDLEWSGFRVVNDLEWSGFPQRWRLNLTSSNTKATNVFIVRIVRCVCVCVCARARAFFCFVFWRGGWVLTTAK